MSNELVLKVGTYARITSAENKPAQALRVYPESPSSLMVQVRAIRGKTQLIYAGAYLTVTDVLELRAYLGAVLKEHFGVGLKMSGPGGAEVDEAEESEEP